MIDRAREIRRARQQREDKESIGRNSVSEISGGGNKGMIKVVRLNGEPLYINFFQVEYMESIPETKIKMMNGDYYLVKDSIDSIAENVKEFVHSCIAFQK